MQSNVYRVCCCFASYYPPPTYQEFDDSDIKLQKTPNEKQNLNTIGAAGGDYRSTVISNPSSSSFEPEISSENEEIAQIANLNTDLYNTNNLNNEQKMQDHDEESVTRYNEEITVGNSRAPSVYNIHSDVSVQLSSWQSASFAMAQASRSTNRIKKRSSEKIRSSNEYLDKVRSRSPSTSRSKKRSRNESEISTVSITMENGSFDNEVSTRNKVDSTPSSSLGRLKERLKEGSVEEGTSVTTGRLGLFKSLAANKNTSVDAKSVERKEPAKAKAVPEVVKQSESRPKEEPKPKEMPKAEEKLEDSTEMSVAREENSLSAQESKTSLMSPVIQPIKRFFGVFSGAVTVATATPLSNATTETVIMSEEVIQEPSEIDDSLSESDVGGSASYSIATSDISTDPSSGEEHPNTLQDSFFPELYEKEQLVGPIETQKPENRRGSWASRYPVYKEEDDLSSIATDELSDTTNELGSVKIEDELSASSMSDYEKFSGRRSELENDTERMMVSQNDELIMDDLRVEFEEDWFPDGYYSDSFVRYDPDGNDFVRYDDPALVETDGSSMAAQRDPDSSYQIESDSNLSFPGRIPADPVLESPVPSSCMDESTLVGSCGTGVTVSSGGDTITAGMSVSRAGVRVEERKKKSGIVSMFKKKVLRK